MNKKKDNTEKKTEVKEVKKVDAKKLSSFFDASRCQSANARRWWRNT